MIDLLHLEKYQENNRIEAKKAFGGLPQSIWETYSAFANTFGGIILLGVEEHKDHSLHPILLPDPERLVREFWAAVNDPRKVNANILSRKHVCIKEVNGKRIVVITVPKAQRADKPIYIGENPVSGAYRRNGEGDYRCTKEEVQGMLRDAAIKTQDMRVLEGVALSALDYATLARYRARMKSNRPDHGWERLSDDEFLHKLGAIARGNDGEFHPTVAGLLLFGREKEIVKQFPHYLLSYEERMEKEGEVVYKISSNTGDWSGNVYEFYFRVCDRLGAGLPTDDEGVTQVLYEGLANSLINADYYGRQGISVVKERKKITFSNPGGFRIDVEKAKAGGVSDPRNGGLIKAFHLLSILEGVGSGIPNMYSVWKKQGWDAPVIEESFAPERITLSLSLEKTATPRGRGSRAKALTRKAAVIQYLTENVTATTKELAELLETEPPRLRQVLAELLAENIIVGEGTPRNRRYRLKR